MVFKKDFTRRNVSDTLIPDLDKHRSTTGYLYTLSQASVSWRSILQSTIAFSIVEDEYMAMTEAMKETIWLQGLLDDLGIEHDLWKITCDSMSAIYLVKNEVYHARTNTLMSSFTLFGRFLIRVTLNYKSFTRKRILSIYLSWLFRE